MSNSSDVDPSLLDELVELETFYWESEGPPMDHVAIMPLIVTDLYGGRIVEQVDLFGEARWHNEIESNGTRFFVDIAGVSPRFWSESSRHRSRAALMSLPNVELDYEAMWKQLVNAKFSPELDSRIKSYLLRRDSQ